MHRALGPLVALSLASCAGVVAPEVAPPPSACSAVFEPSTEVETAIGAEPEWGVRISKVHVDHDRLPADVVRRAIRVREGSLLDPEAVRADVDRLLALEAVENVRVELDGARLVYVIEARPVIRSVAIRGAKPGAGHWLPLAAGELYDPLRVRRMQADLQADLVARGHLDARVETRERREKRVVDVCTLVHRGPRYLIDEIRLDGNRSVLDPVLTSLLNTHGGQVNQRGKPFRKELLDAALPLLFAHYYDRGYIAVHIAEPVVVRDEKRERVRVTIPIEEGAAHRIGAIRFVNAPPAARARYAKELGVVTGEVFSRTRIAEGLERVRASAKRDVELSTQVESTTATVDLSFELGNTP